MRQDNPIYKNPVADNEDEILTEDDFFSPFEDEGDISDFDVLAEIEDEQEQKANASKKEEDSSKKEEDPEVEKKDLRGTIDCMAKEKKAEWDRKVSIRDNEAKVLNFRLNMKYIVENNPLGIDFDHTVLSEIAKRVEHEIFVSTFDLITSKFSEELYPYIFSTWLRSLKSKGNKEGTKYFLENKLTKFFNVLHKYVINKSILHRMQMRLVRLLGARGKDLSCEYDTESLFEGLKKDYRGARNLVKADKDEIEALANAIASVFSLFETVYQHSELKLYEHYWNVADFAEMLNITLPYKKRMRELGIVDREDDSKFSPRQALADIQRTMKEKFWANQLVKMKRRGFDNFAMLMKKIGKKQGQSCYISEKNLDFYFRQQERNFEFLSKSSVISEDGKVQLSMLDVFNASVANPKNRAIELRVRAKGAEMMAKYLEYSAVFVTATVPRRFHPNSSNYDGSSVRDGCNWFLRCWALTRSSLKKEEIKYFGLRCSEPHNDGTMHGHFVIFVEPEKKELLLSIMRDKWVNNEPDGEVGGKWEEGRFNWKDIDPKKGSAVSYITKYVAKNIYSENEKDTSDEDERVTMKGNVSRVRAWASLWSIRQFQFFGLPSVSVYREFRRVANNQWRYGMTNNNCWSEAFRAPEVLPKSFKGVAEACDEGDFYGYIQHQTPIVKEDSIDDGVRWNFAPLSVVYENGYGEIQRRTIGVRSLVNRKEFVLSRTEDWTIEKGKWDGKEEFVTGEENSSAEVPLEEGGGEANASRKSGNNCNQTSKSDINVAQYKRWKDTKFTENPEEEEEKD